jgi:RNA polymerase-binding transcription factor DksA
MTESVERLHGELEEFPGAFEETPLIEEANKLAEALERFRGGEHGTCEECQNPITPARLRATPEVTTCLRCQGRLEHSARRLQTDFRHPDVAS